MSTIRKIGEKIKSGFRFNTLSFLFILVYINFFTFLFGQENSIVAVIFTIMMSASMVRDLTATPVRHLCIQSLVLVWMALAAFWVNTLPVPLAFIIHFITLLLILYSFTYEYSSNMYFPYILSYLFLIFLAPISAQQLPKRIWGMLFGAASILLYQWFMGRNRVAETARDVLCEMTDEIRNYIAFRLKEQSEPPRPSGIRSKLYSLSRTIYVAEKRLSVSVMPVFPCFQPAAALSICCFFCMNSRKGFPMKRNSFWPECQAVWKNTRPFSVRNPGNCPRHPVLLFPERKGNTHRRLLNA